MSRLPRAAILTTALLVALSGTTACGGGSDDDPASTGPRAQAVEKLRDFGLTAEQARCVVDEVGADTVVEAGDVTALAEGQAYRDAAEECIDGA